MSEVRKRKLHGAEFKAKVGMEAVGGLKTINEIGQQYGVHPVLAGRREILERAATLFEGKRGPRPAEHADEDRPYAEDRAVEDGTGLAQVRTMSAETRMGWIDRQAGLAVARQGELAGVVRPKPVRQAGLPAEASAQAGTVQGIGGRPAAVPSDRRGVHAPALLRQPADGRPSGASGPSRQPQAGASG